MPATRHSHDMTSDAAAAAAAAAATGASDNPTPQTPEGLRPRKTLAQLRRDMPEHIRRKLDREHGQFDRLQLAILPRSHTSVTRPSKSSDTIASPLSSCLSNPRDRHCTSASTRDGNIPDHSDIDSNSDSDYNDATDDVARSPKLKVGFARTAVGELLAMTANTPDDNPAQGFLHDSGRHHHHRKSTAVLPPCGWLKEDIEDVDGSLADIADVPYQSLNDTLATPTRKRKDVMDETSSSPSTSAQSSLHASPSSFRRQENGRAYWNAFDGHGDDALYQSGFIDEPNRPDGRFSAYDFDSILDKEIAPMTQDDANMSSISQSTRDFDGIFVDNRRINSNADHVRHPHASGPGWYPPNQLCDVGHRRPTEHHQQVPMLSNPDDMLRMRKRDNHRRRKEELLLSTVDRLRDNVDLVVSVVDELNASGVKEVHFPPEHSNFLAGFSDTNRGALRKHILMAQMEVGEGFQSDVLHAVVNALNFCADVLRTAPDSREGSPNANENAERRHKWRPVPGFRSCIGFEEKPCSPEQTAKRGGDTSIFSLPSESMSTTPHTSNVSVATTITSDHSGGKQEARRRTVAPDGIQLRRTMEMVSAFLIKLNHACLRLGAVGNGGSSLQMTEDIKATYLQLLAIKSGDLQALQDAFEMYLPPLQINRMVSQDCADLPDHGLIGDMQQHMSSSLLFHSPNLSGSSKVKHVSPGEDDEEEGDATGGKESGVDDNDSGNYGGYDIYHDEDESSCGNSSSYGDGDNNNNNNNEGTVLLPRTDHYNALSDERAYIRVGDGGHADAKVVGMTNSAGTENSTGSAAKHTEDLRRDSGSFDGRRADDRSPSLTTRDGPPMPIADKYARDGPRRRGYGRWIRRSGPFLRGGSNG